MRILRRLGSWNNFENEVSLPAEYLIRVPSELLVVVEVVVIRNGGKSDLLSGNEK
jgi:hypothetical protein